MAQSTPPPVNTPVIFVEATLNIFLVDIPSATAEFVGTLSYPHRPSYPFVESYTPVDVNDGYVVWTNDYCSAHGRVRVLDRANGATSELNASWYSRLGGATIKAEPLGPRAALDLKTFTYTGPVLPTGGVSGVVWSPDGRFLLAYNRAQDGPCFG
jgi:hypothetical protein